MPQKLEDEVFKKFIYSISNHKTVESVQLMNFLLKRKTPKNIDLTFESYTLESGVSAINAAANGYNQAIDKNYLNETRIKEAILKSKIKQDLKKVFVLHGAIDIEIPIIAPMQDSTTVFFSMRQ